MQHKTLNKSSWALVFEIQQKWAITYMKRSSIISFYGTAISYPRSILHDHLITKPHPGSYCHICTSTSLRRYHIIFSHFITKWNFHLCIILSFSQQFFFKTRHDLRFLFINARPLNIFTPCITSAANTFELNQCHRVPDVTEVGFPQSAVEMQTMVPLVT